MKQILITGKTGSGKNKLGDMLGEKLGYEHIDIDKICHTCYENQNIVDKVKHYFGESILDENNKVDRKKLGRIVFNDKEKMKILNDLTYNFVIDKIDEIISQNDKPVILNYVLLPNTKYWNADNYKILVKSTDDNERYNRLVKRDNVTREYIISRDNNSYKYSEEEFDYIFNNDYNAHTLESNVECIAEKIMLSESRNE